MVFMEYYSGNMTEQEFMNYYKTYRGHAMKADLSGWMSMDLVKEGQDVPGVLRFLFKIDESGAEWKIIQQH